METYKKYDKEKKKNRIKNTNEKCPNCNQYSLLVLKTFRKNFPFGKKQKPIFYLKTKILICITAFREIWIHNELKTIKVGDCGFHRIEKH